jgi:hypothetical protein
MPNTAIDSIWWTEGTWQLTDDEFIFHRDTGITITIAHLVKEKTMTIIQNPYPGDSCIPDLGICLGVVLGVWTFEFERP